MSKKNEPAGRIEYIENHRPALPSGDYEIEDESSIEETKPTHSEHDSEPFPTEERE